MIHVDSESYFSSETSSEETVGPSTGTSRSSNSTGQPHSDSNSGHDSSSDESTDTEADNSSLSEDLCAHVIMQPDNGSDVWGWVEFYAPALGHFANSVRVEGTFENLENDANDTTNGMHALKIKQYGDLHKGCKSTGDEYTEAKFTDQLMRASHRGLANYYDWNDDLRLDGLTSILGRSIAVYGNGDDANTMVGCGIIQPGCSPCRDGSCFPEKKEEEEHHYRPYHPTGRHHF